MSLHIQKIPLIGGTFNFMKQTKVTPKEAGCYYYSTVE